MFVYIFVLFSLAFSSIYAENNCDSKGVNIYKDMKCTALAVDRHNCPTMFNCPNIRNDTEHCYFKGRQYNRGERLNSTESFCNVGCTCSSNGKFVCAIIECAEYFGIPPAEGCYRTYDLRSCCSIGENCPKGSAPHECKVDGQAYKEGERFFPETSCSMCICQKGFKGKFEAPYCVNRRCNVEARDPQSIQKSCAPLYSREEDLKNKLLCCPTTWICPQGTEVVKGKPKSDDVCKFGNKVLKLGQHIEREVIELQKPKRVICKCKTPPLLTCVKEEYIDLLN